MAIRERVRQQEPPLPNVPRRSPWTLWVAAAIAIAAGTLATLGMLVWNKPITNPTLFTQSYTSPIGYTIAYPDGWSVNRFEGHDELWPSQLPSLEQGGLTLAIDITTPDLSSGPGCTWEAGRAKVAGRPASFCEETQANGGIDEWFAVDIGTRPVKLVVHVVAGTPELHGQYTGLVREILDTIEPIAKPVPANGTVREGIPRNAYTSALIGFLEARVRGTGADYWMSGSAADLYATKAGGLNLYEAPKAGPWVSYVILAYRGVDANSAEFDVSLWSNGTTARETIAVGAGSNVALVSLPAVIRFATAS